MVVVVAAVYVARSVGWYPYDSDSDARSGTASGRASYYLGIAARYEAEAAYAGVEAAGVEAGKYSYES